MYSIKFKLYDKEDKITYEPQTFKEIILEDYEWHTKDDSVTLPPKDFIYYFKTHVLIPFTGFKDSLGIEIYENDYVEFEVYAGEKIKCLTVFDDELKRFVFKAKDGRKLSMYDYSPYCIIKKSKYVDKYTER